MRSVAASSSIVKWVNCQSAAILKDLYCNRLFFKTAENTGKVFRGTVAHYSVPMHQRAILSQSHGVKGQDHSHYNYQEDKKNKRFQNRQLSKMFHRTSISEIVRISGLFHEQLNIMHISDYSSAQVIRIFVTVSILSTLFCNIVLVFILLKQVTFKMLFNR